MRTHCFSPCHYVPASNPQRFSFLTPELQQICCLADRRVQSWATPPNHSAADWADERGQIAEFAAYKAVIALKENGTAHPARFIFDQIVSSVRTHYRREWSYGLHFEVCDKLCSSEENDYQEQNLHSSQDDENPAYAELHDALNELDADSRSLIEQLFFIRKTEGQVGQKLHISQVGVNKRKQLVLSRLRATLAPRLLRSVRSNSRQ